MKTLIIALGAAAGGIALVLAGLAVDAWLHARDTTLAGREGIFTLSNPGHLLLALGLVVVCGGIGAALYAAWGLAAPRGLLGRRWLRLAALQASALASVAAVAFALSVSDAGHDHPQAGDAAQAEQAPAPDAAGGSLAAAAGASATHDHTAMESAGTAPAPAPVAQSDAVPEAHPHTADVAASTLVSAAPAGGDAHASHEAPPATADVAPAMPADDGHAHATGEVTAADEACGQQLLADVREATKRFEDFDVAVAEGYVKNTPGTVVAHYHSWAYARDGKVLDLARPEDLMYVNTPEGMRLAGVMFLALRGESGPQVCGAVTTWHTHTNVCFSTSTGAVVALAKDGVCPAGSILFVPPEMLHVWLIPNPNGTFDEQMDPRVLRQLFD